MHIRMDSYSATLQSIITILEMVCHFNGKKMAHCYVVRAAFIRLQFGCVYSLVDFLVA